MSKPVDLRNFSPEKLSDDEYTDFLLELPVIATWSSGDGDFPGGDQTINLVGGDGFYVIYNDSNGFGEPHRELSLEKAIKDWLSELPTELVSFDDWFEKAFESLADSLADLPEARRDQAVEFAREAALEGANEIDTCCYIAENESHKGHYLIDRDAADWAWSEHISYDAQRAAESWVAEIEAEEAAALAEAEPDTEPALVDEIIWRVVRGEPAPWQLETVTRRADGLWWDGVKSADTTPNRKSPFAKRGPFENEAEIALDRGSVFWDDDCDSVIIDKIPMVFRVDYPIVVGPAAKSAR